MITFLLCLAVAGLLVEVVGAVEDSPVLVFIGVATAVFCLLVFSVQENTERDAGGSSLCAERGDDDH